MEIFIDIETIPSQRQDVFDMIRESITPPGNITKEESIAKWWSEKGTEAIDIEWRKTALNGTFGEIICIAWAIDDEDPHAVSRTLEESEADMLQQFFDQLAAVILQPGRPQAVTWIGHYISGFDLRIIWQRAVINGVRPPFKIPYDAKPWSDVIYDTKVEWSGLNSRGGGSQDHICKAMGFPGKGDMDGSKVWDAIKAGEYDKVTLYCIDDVTDVRHIYRRMTFKETG